MTQFPRRARSYLDPDVENFLEEQAETAKGPTQVHKELEAYLAAKGKTDKFVSLRTVQARLKEYRSFRDPSGRWDIARAEPDSVEALMSILADVIERTDGGKTFFTNAEAQWLVRLRRAAPDLEPWALYRLARTYIRRHDAGQDTADLDCYLALAPWRGHQERLRYMRLVAQGKISRAPAFLLDKHWPDSWVDLSPETVQHLEEFETRLSVAALDREARREADRIRAMEEDLREADRIQTQGEDHG